MGLVSRRTPVVLGSAARSRGTIMDVLRGVGGGGPLRVSLPKVIFGFLYACTSVAWVFARLVAFTVISFAIIPIHIVIFIIFPP